MLEWIMKLINRAYCRGRQTCVIILDGHSFELFLNARRFGPAGHTLPRPMGLSTITLHTPYGSVDVRRGREIAWHFTIEHPFGA